jgi:hypothetical protein
MTFSASFCCNVVFGSAFKADLKEQPSLLGYLFFSCICSRHSLSLKVRMISSFLFLRVQSKITAYRKAPGYPKRSDLKVLDIEYGRWELLLAQGQKI